LTENDSVVIIGAGLMGSAAAWALSRRGRPVTLIEQFDIGHQRGSSHGSARIVRRAYSDALYIELTGYAFERWDELSAESGATPIRILGGLDFGPTRDVPAIDSMLTDAHVPHELLSASEAARRWPGMNFDGDVIYHPQAGVVDPDVAVRAMVDQARAAGATVLEQTTVTAVQPVGDRVEVRCADGTEITAGCAVVAAGGWATTLLDGLVDLPPLSVSQEQVFHFPRLDPSVAPWPSVIHERDPAEGHAVYHLAGGRDGGPGDDRKIGLHYAGTITTAADRDGRVSDEVRERAVDYVRRWLPGLDPTPSSETTCLYTSTASQDFVLDRVGPIVICSPCSGHGAKFAPLIGEYVADLATGGDPPPDRFRIAAHAAAPAGRPVSL
jgi:sarcosine oxidase